MNSIAHTLGNIKVVVRLIISAILLALAIASGVSFTQPSSPNNIPPPIPAGVRTILVQSATGLTILEI